MSIPDTFINGGNMWVQSAEGGAAVGHPDVTLGFYFTGSAGKEDIHFKDYSIKGKSWSDNIEAQVTYRNKEVLFQNPRTHDAETLRLVSTGVVEWDAATKAAKLAKGDHTKAYFYATSAPFDAKTSKPYATGAGAKGTQTGDSTSQSTMYVIGRGALIVLLFLFTQKK